MEQLRTREALAGRGKRSIEVDPAQWAQFRRSCEAARTSALLTLTKQRDEAERLLQFAQDAWDEMKVEVEDANARLTECWTEYTQLMVAYVRTAALNVELRKKISGFRAQGSEGKQAAAGRATDGTDRADSTDGKKGEVSGQKSAGSGRKAAVITSAKKAPTPVRSAARRNRRGKAVGKG